MIEESTRLPQDNQREREQQRLLNQRAVTWSKYLSGNNLLRISLIRSKLFPDRYLYHILACWFQREREKQRLLNQRAVTGSKYLSGNNLLRISLIRSKLFPDRYLYHILACWFQLRLLLSVALVVSGKPVCRLLTSDHASVRLPFLGCNPANNRADM